MEITLGKDQLLALNEIEKFIKSNDLSYSIIGEAGTGKSLLIKYVINHLEKNNKGYILCAPTHRAKVVLETFSQREAITVHKLLSLRPNIEILELDFRELLFKTSKGSSFPINEIIICDESSMISDDLYDLLILRAKENNCKLIFVGDIKQLRPVKAITHSKVFTQENKFELTHIYRQSEDSGVFGILPILRNSIIKHFETIKGKNGSVIVYNDTKEFVKQSLISFKKAAEENNILEAKILTYTNKRVTGYNQIIKRLLHGENQYYKSVFLTAYENLTFNNISFWNSMDYIISKDPVNININIPNYKSLPGYRLTLYDASNKIESDINILDINIPESELSELSKFIECIRLDAIEAKKRRVKGAGKIWADYYKVLESFTTPIDLYYDNRLIRKKSFDYGYACTSHKSQALSINNVFIDMKDINLCKDPEELRQLQYVSVSRTRNNVNILQ